MPYISSPLEQADPESKKNLSPQKDIMEDIETRQTARGAWGKVEEAKRKLYDPNRVNSIESSKRSEVPGRVESKNQLKNFKEALGYIEMGMRATAFAAEIARIMPDSALSVFMDNAITETTIQSIMNQIKQDKYGGTVPSPLRSKRNSYSGPLYDDGRFSETLELDGTANHLEQQIRELFCLKDLELYILVSSF